MLEQLGAFLARPFNSSNEIKSDFIRLPEDILWLIIKKLSVHDLSMLYQSCRYFKKLSGHAELPIIRLSNAAFKAMRKFPTICGIDDDLYISVYYGKVINYNEVKFSDKGMLDFHVRVRQTLDQIKPSLFQKFALGALGTRFYKEKSIVATDFAPGLDPKVKASLMASIEYLNASYSKNN